MSENVPADVLTSGGPAYGQIIILQRDIPADAAKIKSHMMLTTKSSLISL
jgi:hypothetical protein